jgi:hypothetical protein
MTGDREERNRVLGFPVERHPRTRPASKPQQAAQAQQAQPGAQDAEPQRVLGLPVDWLDGFADEILRMLRRIGGNGNLRRRK